MYGWVFRHLPGSFRVRVVLSLGIIISVVAVLWFFVFPFLAERIGTYSVLTG